MNPRTPAHAPLHCCLLIVALLSGCAHPPAPPTQHAGLRILHAVPAQNLPLKTRGTLRPQYRAAGIAGQPMPYENAVESSLMLCAGLGPLFGACAGVLVGAAAVAGVTETLVDGLQQSGLNKADTSAVTDTLAPAADFATALAAGITATAHGQLVHEGRDALVGTDSLAACAAARADTAAAYLTEVDIADLELEFEPGYQYRLTVVARARTRSCAADSATAERRLAYRSRLQVLSGDTTRARAGFDAEVAAAVAQLGADLARHLTGAL